MKKKNPNTELPNLPGYSGVSFKKPLIQKHLDIYIGHITKKDNALLIEACKADTENPVIAYDYEYGYIVICGPNLTDSNLKSFKKYGYSKNFIAILDRAQKFGCVEAHFDCDGAQYDDLEIFSW